MSLGSEASAYKMAPVLKERSGPGGQPRSAGFQQLAGSPARGAWRCRPEAHRASAGCEGMQLWTLKLCTHALYICMYVCMKHEISLSKMCVFSILA